MDNEELIIDQVSEGEFFLKGEYTIFIVENLDNKDEKAFKKVVFDDMIEAAKYYLKNLRKDGYDFFEEVTCSKHLSCDLWDGEKSGVVVTTMSEKGTRDIIILTEHIEYAYFVMDGLGRILHRVFNY